MLKKYTSVFNHKLIVLIFRLITKMKILLYSFKNVSKNVAFSFLLWLGGLAFSSFDLIAQQVDDFCGTKEVDDRTFEKLPWFGDNDYLREILDSCGYFQDTPDSTKVLFRVPVQLFVYRDRNNKKGFNDLQVKRVVQELNYFNTVNNTGFLYYILPIKYVRNKRRLKMGYRIEAPIQTYFRRVDECVNVHLINSLQKKKLFGRSIFVRGSYNYFTEAVILSKNSSSTSLAHEIGHFLGLHHPHRNWTKGKCRQEAVSRTRTYDGCFKKGVICEQSGDGLCDTPAEPDLTGRVSDDCEYTDNQLTDNWGDKYLPATDNIMSYPEPRSCREKFTLGQIAVMVYTAREKNIEAWHAPKYKNAAQNAYIFDKYEPDDNREMATLLHLGKTQIHTFHKCYLGKENKDLDTDIDWYSFEVKDVKSSEIEIRTYPSKIAYSSIELVLFSNGGLEIEKATPKSNEQIVGTTLKVKELSRGKYFLRIMKMKKSESPIISGYKIEMTKKNSYKKP